MNKDIVYLINPSSSQTWVLNGKQKTIIGRGISQNAENSLILLPHPTVSKLHAHLWLDEQTQQWYFENTSKNGSSIHGKEIQGKQVLHDGDKITIGPFDLLFCENLLNEEGTVEVKKPDIQSAKWENSPTKLELFTIYIIFGFAVVLFFFWIRKMFL